MKKRIVFIPLILISLFMCNQVTHKKSFGVTIRTSERLKQWKLEANVKTFLDVDTLCTHVTFTGTSIRNPDGRIYPTYYLDSISNTLISKLIVYENRHEIDSYPLFKLRKTFLEPNEVFESIITSREIKEVVNEFSDTIFYNNVLFTLSNFNYEESTFFRSTINGIVQDVPEFKNKISFWNLLQKYSEFCTNPSDLTKKEAKLFIMFAVLLEPFYKDYLKESTPKKMKSLVTRQGFDLDVFEYNLSKLDSVLDSRISER